MVKRERASRPCAHDVWESISSTGEGTGCGDTGILNNEEACQSDGGCLDVDLFSARVTSHILSTDLSRRIKVLALKDGGCGWSAGC